jgi:hypothetical protein
MSPSLLAGISKIQLYYVRHFKLMLSDLMYHYFFTLRPFSSRIKYPFMVDFALAQEQYRRAAPRGYLYENRKLNRVGLHSD